MCVVSVHTFTVHYFEPTTDLLIQTKDPLLGAILLLAIMIDKQLVGVQFHIGYNQGSTRSRLVENLVFFLWVGYNKECRKEKLW